MTSLKIWLVILVNYADGCFTLFGLTDIKVSQIVVPRNFRTKRDIRKVGKYSISTPFWTRDMKKLIIVIMILFGKEVR